MMKKITMLSVLSILTIFVLAACGNNNDEAANNNNDEELPMIDVDYQLPETAEAGETVELVAVVTYEGEPVEDATQMDFEVWEKGDQDNSEMLEGEHAGDGKYVASYTFEDDGIFESYAHTTAEGIHAMPKLEITIGEGGDYDHVEEDNNDEEHHEGHHEGH